MIINFSMHKCRALRCSTYIEEGDTFCFHHLKLVKPGTFDLALSTDDPDAFQRVVGLAVLDIAEAEGYAPDRASLVPLTPPAASREINQHKSSVPGDADSLPESKS